MFWVRTGLDKLKAWVSGEAGEYDWDEAHAKYLSFLTPGPFQRAVAAGEESGLGLTSICARSRRPADSRPTRRRTGNASQSYFSKSSPRFLSKCSGASSSSHGILGVTNVHCYCTPRPGAGGPGGGGTEANAAASCASKSGAGAGAATGGAPSV